MDERLIKLEETVAFQDAIINKLNDTVAEHEILMHKLGEKLRRLELHVREAMPALTVAPQDDTPPPHY